MEYEVYSWGEEGIQVARKFYRLLVGLMVWTLILPGGVGHAAVGVPSLADASESYPDTSYLSFLAAHGLIQGSPDGQFRPDAPMTRGEAAAIAVRVAGLSPRAPGKGESVPGIPESHWAAPYIRAGLEAGLFTLPDNGGFLPDGPLTRADLATWAVRAAREPVNRLPDMQLADVKPQTQGYPEILLAVASGMMAATNGHFRPEATASRGEAMRAFATAVVFTPLAFDTPLAAVVEPHGGQVEIADSASAPYSVIATPTPLKEGGMVRTSGVATADINFPDGSALRLAQDSDMLLIRSHGTQQVWGTGVEDLDVSLLLGRPFGALMPLLEPQDVSLKEGPVRLARLPMASDSGVKETAGDLPADAARLLLFSDPGSLEPGDTAGAELTAVLADDAGNPVTAEQGVQLQLLSDTGRFSNPNPVIPAGYQAVSVQLYPPDEEPPDAKTRVTATAGELASTAPPEPPARMAPREQAQWSAQKDWVAGVSERIARAAPRTLKEKVKQENDESATTVASLPRDITPPSIAITSPANRATIVTPTVEVTGRASDDVGLASVDVGGAAATLSANGRWSATITLSPGSNLITASATDSSGNTATTAITVKYDPAQSGLSLTAQPATRESQVEVTGGQQHNRSNPD